jgi:hypothetical protein
MGCAEDGIISILYAKAGSLRTHSKSRRDRLALTQKATAPVSPTIICVAQRRLKYFLDYFATFATNYLPPLMIGHSPERSHCRSFQCFSAPAPLPLADYMKTQTLKRYLSDLMDDRHRSLTAVLTPEAMDKAKLDQFDSD